MGMQRGMHSVAPLFAFFAQVGHLQLACASLVPRIALMTPRVSTNAGNTNEADSQGNNSKWTAACQRYRFGLRIVIQAPQTQSGLACLCCRLPPACPCLWEVD